jgi:iron complex outermembrane receptor protein
LHPAAQGQVNQVLELSINMEAQNAEDGVKSLAREFRRSVFFQVENIAVETTNPVRGVVSLQTALERMFEGTSLTGSLTKSGAIIVSPRKKTDIPGEEDEMKKSVLSVTSALAIMAGNAAAQDVSVIDAPTTTEAQEERTLGLSTITVTARRVEESLQDVPGAVAVVSPEIIAAQRIQSVNQILEITPGATFTSLHKGQQDFSIRGISSQTEGAAGDSAVATYIDNVAIGRDFAKSFEFFDIAQVEVLRGPQGTSFGRNASAGLIHIISKRPSHEPDGLLEATAGNYGLIDASGAFGGRIAEGVSGRLSVHYDEREGYTTDTSSGRDIDPEQNATVRAQLLFEPSDTVEFLLRGTWSQDDDGSTVRRGPDCEIPYLGAPFGDYTEPCDEWETDISERTDLTQERTIINTSAEAVWDVTPGVRLTSVTGYLNAEMERSQDIFGTPLDLLISSSVDEAWQFSQELRIDNYLAGDAFQWLAGLYYYTDDHNRDGDNRDVLPFAGPFATQTTLMTNNKTTSYGLFGRVGYDLTDRLNVTVGGRYTLDQKDFSVFHSATGGVAPIFVDPADDPVDVEIEDEWNKFAGSASIDYQLKEDVIVYGLISQGYKAGGFDGEPSSRAAALTPFDEETSTNYEVGVKSELFDRRLRLNTSVFYVDYEDLQVADFLPSGAPIIINSGGAKVTGLELESEASVNEFLTLSGSLALMDAELEGEVGGVSVAGNRPDNAPEWTVNFAADITVPLSSGAEVGLRADYTGRSEVYDGPFGDPATIRPEVHFIGAQVSWLSVEQDWEMIVWGRNLTEEADVLSRGPVSTVLQSPTAYGAPRTYGVTLRKTF